MKGSMNVQMFRISNCRFWNKKKNDFINFTNFWESICAIISLIMYQLSRGIINGQKSGRRCCLRHCSDNTFTNILQLGARNSKTRVPNRSITLPTVLVYLLHSLHRFANATAAPIKRCSTGISCLSLPLTIYQQRLT